jgi:histidyl-tRNA synthetase
LMESLGGPATPAVGWAAGIERLAMLVGEIEEAAVNVIVVVEDDSSKAQNHGWYILQRVRDEGFSAELIATGSPRKRYDKAVKRGADAIFKCSENGHGLSMDGATDPRLAELLDRLS